MKRPLHSLLFAVVCLAGAVTAVALTIHEAIRTPPVVAHVAGTARVGLTTTVTVTVRDTTSGARCVVVRVAGRDRAGHDLAAVIAAPALELTGHDSRTVVARLALTPRQYAEQLDAFYPSVRPCGGSESGN